MITGLVIVIGGCFFAWAIVKGGGGYPDDLTAPEADHAGSSAQADDNELEIAP